MKKTVATAGTVSKQGAISGTEYVLLVVKDQNVENLLAADNLLYIDQKTAESTTVTFTYNLSGNPVATVYGQHNHAYTSAVTTEPSCETSGVRTYTCVDGDDSYTETIPALGHTDDNNDGHCDRCGTQMTGGDHCKFCGKIHNGGFFDKLTGFFHKIFAIFKR